MIQLDTQLDLQTFVAVVRNFEKVTLSAEAIKRVQKSRRFIEHIVEKGDPVYGVNTGFGKFQNTRIERDQLEQLQRNLILSHSIGVGHPFPTDVVRGMLLLRAQSLALGHSGVRPEIIESLLAFLNHQIHPVVPSQGSVGSSGDLAPLSHLTLALIGEGEVEHQGKIRSAREVMAEVGLEPIVLQAKEGLALINGTQAMCSLLALLVHDVGILLSSVDIAAACSVEALKGSHKPFSEEIVRLRPHPGAIEVSENLRKLLSDSEIAHSHENCEKVQDAYSLRATPQVHGASRDALRHARTILEIEMNSVTDNPLIFPDEQLVISGGNFHGQPLALAADYAGIAIAELANISERRIEQMLNPALSGLPAFLAEQGGLNSGLMISQYTAASLVSENKVLAHPASVDSIPTSANQEDHVSMGTIACRKAHQIYENTLWVIAIEMVSGAQALDFHAPLHPGKGVRAVYEAIRAEIPHLERDRYFQPEVGKIRECIRSGQLLAVANKAVGSLY